MTGTWLSAAARRVRGSAVRELLTAAGLEGMISLAGGSPNPALFDHEELGEAARITLAELSRTALQYGPSEGQLRLRRRLQEVSRTRGIDVADECYLVTTGSQQGLDLVARMLLDPGDVVAVEQPTYLAALQAFDLCGATYVTVPADRDGMCVEHLAKLPRKPKLIYVVPNFANPTGATLARQRRLELLEWAVHNSAFVLEDDPYGELYFDAPPPAPLAALAREVPGAERCCGYLSSLSKILAPGLRIGWLVLPPELAPAAVRLKQALDLHTSSLAQEIAAEYLSQGMLQLRLPVLREAYARQRDALTNALRHHFGDALRFDEPRGGLFVWARFRTYVDTGRLLPLARSRGVAFVPGAAFFRLAPECSTLRLSFANGSPDDLGEAVSRLRRAFDDYLRINPQVEASGAEVLSAGRR